LDVRAGARADDLAELVDELRHERLVLAFAMTRIKGSVRICG